ncbi:MAG: helix-turn-helix domain-containing protein [Bacillota bacterium]
MKCYVCGGEMDRTKKDIEANWKGRQVIFRGMEPWVCQSCGEEVYEPDDVRLMQTLMRGTMSVEDYPQIMNVEEVADLLRVSTQTVYNLARSGKLPAVKVGREWRFNREKVLEVLNRHTSREEAPVCEGRAGDGASRRPSSVVV